ncbi:hypothetical protein DVR12_24990 [Chitinophaga silvatica]|uniref:Uncharacterized protein n=1 Tax=Chitinophaga silvatica TaxID=2282649 RepID=A0A3E1Y301_9BACT|nr:hypothetical protein [Chitinophaga silvatica]RFS19068.1 hypothetical protein DVR12_24990 [Chitinophaga silvatica]
MLKISLDELFKEQSQTHFLATIEPLVDTDFYVKVTPWVKEVGCICNYSFDMLKILYEAGN